MSKDKALYPMDCVAKGENPHGIVVQTCNETVRDGVNEEQAQGHYDLQADGPRWNSPLPFMETVPQPVGKIPKPRPGKRGR